MLRTIMYTTGPRGAARLPVGIRSGLRPQSMPNFLIPTPLRKIPKRTFNSSRSTSKPAKTTTFTFSSYAQPSRLRNQTILQWLRSSIRSFHNSRARLNGKPTSPDPTSNLNSPPKGSSSSSSANAEPTTLGGRLKKLSREYGWSAFGVYLALTAVDFPFCYLLVRYLGTDRIGEWEHLLVSNIKRLIPESVKQTWHEWRQSMKKAEHDMTGGEEINNHVEMAGWGVEEAEKRNKSEASLATQLALAYAIHKSFIFIRVPITVAITPRVVKVLRGWGWDIGKRTTKEAKAIKRAALPPKPKRR